MARRLTALVLALAALLGPLVAAAPAAIERPARVGCCGESCRCDTSCPCAAKDDRGAPSGETPAAPAPTRDARAFLVLLPSQVATLELHNPRAGAFALPLRERDAPSRAGRAILELVSRWTT